jgi:tRNA(adenine34) deaminase
MTLNMTKVEQAAYEDYMRVCLDLAQIAKARGDSPVGSILVQNGKVIAEGIEGGKTHRDITFHAEIEAIRNARTILEKTDLSDCILVTTHEPCIMCSYVIRHHSIKLIIVGLTTGEIGGYSSALPLLLDRSISKWAEPPRIIEGILAQACRELNE